MPSNVQVNLDTTKLDALKQQTPPKAKAWTLEMAKILLQDIEDHWSGEVPSAPGQAPAVRSGALAASVEAIPERDENDPNHPTAIVSASAKYAGYLEYGTSKMAARPWMRPAVIRVRQIVGRRVRELIEP